MKTLLTGLIFACCTVVASADLPYINWENHPIHALDLSPDRSRLAVTHTADQRVQLFDVSTGTAVSIGHVLVGVDPVSVRFRNSDELWVVNHISDSISIVDVNTRQLRQVLQTADEPFDVVFAQNRAFVSCSQANSVMVFELQDLSAPPRIIEIAAEDPRALAVSSDGKTVYAAIFESGNASTVLIGGLEKMESRIPNAVSDVRGPYGGQNPPPNAGNAFNPPLNPAAVPPRVSLIVKRDAAGRWMDDNNHDWTRFVSGDLAQASGRVTGWNVVDRDVAVIDAQSLALRYETGLMNMVMAIAPKPGSAELSVVGTEAFNEIRYEPNINGRFVKAMLASVGGNRRISDLNGHLSYQQPTTTQANRDLSVGDPRALVWNAAGTQMFVAGLGSNNVAVFDGFGARVGAPIRVGQGPVGLALDEGRNRLYVWNHFDATLSVVDATSRTELSRVAAFNPLPNSIRQGRALLYDTQRTSGLGQASCASCHVDARMDKLAWDLGDPSQAPAAFDQNCTTGTVRRCEPYHAMKGPMSTQTMQDIIGHEPLHWRGDRKSIEAFNPAFKELLGDDQMLNAVEMQSFKDFLSSVRFPPNPFRNIDNSLPENLPLKGQRTSGRFAMRGLPLPNGNAKRGLDLYTRSFLDNQLQCASCHTLPTGMAVNGPILATIFNVPIGGSVLPLGPMGENHLGVISQDGFTNVSIKVPQLRNMHEKVGMEFTNTESLSGFGFAHDGSIDSLANFFSASLFSPQSDQDIADLVALHMAFSGSDFGDVNPRLSNNAPQSKDTHAAVGQQAALTGSLTSKAAELLALARAGKIDLIAQKQTRSYQFVPATSVFAPDDRTTAISPDALAASGSSGVPVVFTAVPAGLGKRLGVDRDGDGIENAIEIAQGSNPTDAASRIAKPVAGMWFNPARSGHGFDVQFAGNIMFVSWFTYADDGAPIWYQAVGDYGTAWTGKLNRFVWNPQTKRATGTEVGELQMRFESAQAGVVNWRVGQKTGQEPLQPLIALPVSLTDRTGNWFDPTEPGWGIGIYTRGDVNFSILYFYDGNNQPRWVVGQTTNASQTTMAMSTLRGACPDCAYVAPTLAPAGELRFNFDGARKLSVQTDVIAGTTPTVRWQRGPVAAAPLSEAPMHPERF